MIKAGKKTKQWAKDRQKIKNEFVLMGITNCEIGLEGCWTIIQGFAHGDKRRNLTPEELRHFVIGACNPCHQKIEYECDKWTGKTMREFVKDIISKRG